MSTGTRAATAATSRLAKQEIVRLLFGKKFSKTGPTGHRLLDYSIYSYTDLKKAYLERVQEIHPDKLKQNQDLDSGFLEQSRDNFHELQNAWQKYEVMAKAMRTFNKNEKDEPSNFTMFGVGCSFSDNEEERAMRNEITDQACRGWFSSGALAASNAKEEENSAEEKQRISLADDTMFEVSKESLTDTIAKKTKSQQPGQKLATLIPGLKLRKT